MSVSSKIIVRVDIWFLEYPSTEGDHSDCANS